MIPHGGYFNWWGPTGPDGSSFSRENWPHTVYILSNAANETIYVGITWRWGNRRAQHKRKHWWPQVAHINLLEVPDRYTARTMEWVLIRSRKPQFNKQGVITPEAA